MTQRRRRCPRLKVTIGVAARLESECDINAAASPRRGRCRGNPGCDGPSLGKEVVADYSEDVAGDHFNDQGCDGFGGTG